MLLTGYQKPAVIRRLGAKCLETWRRKREVLRADQLAETAVAAAGRQHTSLPEEKLTCQMVQTLAKEVVLFDEQVAELGQLIKARIRDHQHFDVTASMSGLGIILSAEFLAATGGDMALFGTPTDWLLSGTSPPVPRRRLGRDACPQLVCRLYRCDCRRADLCRSRIRVTHCPTFTDSSSSSIRTSRTFR